MTANKAPEAEREAELFANYCKTQFHHDPAPVRCLDCGPVICWEDGMVAKHWLTWQAARAQSPVEAAPAAQSVMQHALDVMLRAQAGCADMSGSIAELRAALSKATPGKSDAISNDSSFDRADSAHIIASQVSAWRKEIARLQDLIETATGAALSKAGQGGEATSGAVDAQILQIAVEAGKRYQSVTAMTDQACIEFARAVLAKISTAPPSYSVEDVYAKISSEKLDSSRLAYEHVQLVLDAIGMNAARSSHLQAADHAKPESAQQAGDALDADGRRGPDAAIAIHTQGEAT